MNFSRSINTVRWQMGLALLLAATAGSLWAAEPKAIAAPTRSPPASEVAACARMADRAAKASCLVEARSAAALPPSSAEAPGVLRENELKRCNALPEPDKRDCIARMQGKGNVSGSVQGGGVLRELVTREVGVPRAGAASAASPASASASSSAKPASAP